MNKTSILVWLAGVQVVVAVVLAAFCAYNVYATRTLNSQGRQLAAYAQNERSLNALAGMTLSYAATNRIFDAALAQAGLKDRPTSTSLTSPNAPKR